MLLCQKVVEIRNGGKWEKSFVDLGETPEALAQNFHDLAYDLAAHFIGHADIAKRVTRKQNYNGTTTYVITATNGFRVIYTTNIY